ncbi:hypothetical protein RND81_10G238400 [Saponaria officinalis]|uniref:Uncharacterized protein n=1 Tax=Saponaria officinalis TaxID=3572 RepID=A0AAW1I7Y6_SAPOF
MKKGIKRERELGTTMAKVERSIVLDYRKAYDSMYRPERKISYTKKKHLEKIEDRLLRNEDYKQQSVEFANAALRRINHGQELLYHEVLSSTPTSRLSGGEIIPMDQYYLLFAQIRLIGDGPTDLTMFADCCDNLGIFDELPEEVYEGGCQYCSTLYHPVGGCRKLLRGCVNDDIAWLHRKIIRGHLRPSWYKYVERLRHSGSCGGSCGKQDV